MPDLPADAELRPMTDADVTEALAVLRANDPDDAEAAGASYRESLDGQFVIEQRGRIIGVTGMRPYEGTDGAWLLSWNAMHPEDRSTDAAAAMIDIIVQLIEAEGGRKVFASVSDRVEVGAPGPHRLELSVLRDIGFDEELRHPDYYAPGESVIWLGRRLKPRSPVQTISENAPILAVDWDEIEECDDAWFIDWSFTEDEFASRPSFEEAINEARRDGARCMFVSGASEVEALWPTLRDLGFRDVGALADFYADGVDELHFRLDLTL